MGVLGYSEYITWPLRQAHFHLFSETRKASMTQCVALPAGPRVKSHHCYLRAVLNFSV